MNENLRQWELTVFTYMPDGQYAENVHHLESTGTINPQPTNQFLNWNGAGLVISYNSNNVYRWTMEEVTEDV